MTVITHARQKSRLSTLIDSAGGVSVGVALSRARANVGALRSRAVEEVAGHIRALGELPTPTSPDLTRDALPQVYQYASHIVDAAAPFEMNEICAAALSLCEAADRAAGEAQPDWRVIEVHIKSLRLLNALPPEAAAERGEITAQLKALVARKFG